MVIEYDGKELSSSELGLGNKNIHMKNTSNIINKKVFTITETVKQIVEQRKFINKSPQKGVKILESMLNNINSDGLLDDIDIKLEMCTKILFSQYSIQMLDYTSISLENEKDRKYIRYILKTYGIPDDIFDEILTRFHEKIKYKQKKSEK